ncbi:MAG: DUF559 domain-containing protein [Candidatus Edwardsbacteria bacterium]|nr:DUF559 domain-containing protein [Candidatus Edwardsbacteria bacterium]
MTINKTHRPGICTGHHVKTEKHELAKKMRRNMTYAEKCFWNSVRNNKFLGYQFRRQQIVHGFIADFYCNDLNLVVEIDGGVHEEQKDYDKLRDYIINQYGIKVIRFSNQEIIDKCDLVLKRIQELIK